MAWFSLIANNLNPNLEHANKNMKPLSQIAYEAYYGPMFKYAHTSADKKRRFGKVAKIVALVAINRYEARRFKRKLGT